MRKSTMIMILVATIFSTTRLSAASEATDLPPLISPYITKDFTNQDAMLSYFFSMDAEQRATAIITNDNTRGVPYLVIHRARDGQRGDGGQYATWTMYPYPGHVAGAASYMTMGFIVVATGNPELPFAVVVHRSYFGAENRVILDASLETR